MRENVQGVCHSVDQHPKLSTRQWGTALGLSRTSTQRILKSLKLPPYRMSMVQELKLPDLPYRLNFCFWLFDVAYHRANLKNFLF